MRLITAIVTIAVIMSIGSCVRASMQTSPHVSGITRRVTSQKSARLLQSRLGMGATCHTDGTFTRPDGTRIVYTGMTMCREPGGGRACRVLYQTARAWYREAIAVGVYNCSRNWTHKITTH